MPKTRILFEAGPMLDAKKSGVGYFVGHLIDSLQASHGDDLELTGYYFNFFNRRPDKTQRYGSLNFYKVWLIPGKIISVCRRIGFQPWLELFVRKHSEAVFFTNYVSLPMLKRRKTILAVYDLGFLDAPEYIQEVNLKFLRRFGSSSIQKADVIVTISEFTRQRLAYHFPNLKARVVVCSIPPISQEVCRVQLSSALVKKGLKPDSYILYVGTIEPRKNLENLVAAYTKLPRETREKYALVLAGGKGWKDQEILKSIADQQAKGFKIILTDYFSDEDKEALYGNAACFVLPSHYEGFGMPILEAMHYTLPVALSDIPVFHEVAANAALYFDRNDPASIAKTLTTVLETPVKEKLLAAAASNLKRFSWEENARLVYEALK